MAATVKQLRDRWRKPGWREKDAAIRSWCKLELGTFERRPPPDPSVLWKLLDGLPFREEIASGWDLRGSNFVLALDAEFDGFDASYCGALTVIQCRFANSRFVQTGPWHEMWGRFERCDFSSSRLQRLPFKGGPITQCSFDQAKLVGAKALRVDFSGSSFRGAKLRRAELGECDFRGCDFTDADLTDAVLTRSRIDETTIFRGTRLVNVTTDQDWGPPERHSHLDLRIGQFDERTVFEPPANMPPASFWHSWLSAIMHHLRQSKDKRWAPILKDVVERKRQSLGGKAPEDLERWSLEIIEAVEPADRPEVEAFLEEASKGM